MTSDAGPQHSDNQHSDDQHSGDQHSAVGGGPSRLLVAWDPQMERYDFGPLHPMQPVRLRLAMSLSRALRLLDGPDVLVEAPPVATDAELNTVHTPDLVAAVRASSAGAGPVAGAAAFGIGSSDNPAFPGMHLVSARAVGGSLLAARAVADGRARVAVNLAGGLHHAMPGRAAGFCVYNDVAVAIRDLLARGFQRVAYVDTDVHHGDGVQTVFADDPRVLTVSLHQDPTTLWPGTGRADDTGGPGGAGAAVNIPLPPRTGDAGWRRAFDAVVPPVLRAYRPQILVTQHGCDTHRADPLGGLRLSVEGQRAAALDLAALADELCAGRWVVTGGGGYDLLDVVPRTWAHVVAAAGGQPLDPSTPLPARWLAERAAARSGISDDDERVVTTMGDGADAGFRRFGDGRGPTDPVDRAIRAVRAAAFPNFGLDPALD